MPPGSGWRWLPLLCVLLLAGSGNPQQHAEARQPTLTPQNSGTPNRLIAVSAVDARVVWAAGRNGTYAITVDGGQTWHSGVVYGAEKLEFRDVEAVSDKVAYLLSTGPAPTDFRIYKTVDGGSIWRMQFQNRNPKAFYDCFAFWDATHGIAVSDSVGGVFPDLRTTDGNTWQDISRNLPPALADEASFASSGTCIATQGQSNAWIVTGGATLARVLATTDNGNTWNAYPIPLSSGKGAGAFTVAFRDTQNGVAGGGNLDRNHPEQAATAVSHDGGRTWKIASRPPVTGAIYGLSYISKGSGRHDPFATAAVITANEGGAAWTPDEGATWFKLPNVTGYWAVTFANPHAGWLVGDKGHILKISF